VVGAYHKDTAGALSTGKVYVYSWEDATSTYVEVATITASDACAFDDFGYAVAIAGNRVVVGAFSASPSHPQYTLTCIPTAGKVYVYNWDADTSTYAEVAILIAADAAVNNRFGSSLAIKGDTLVVGAAYQDTPGSDIGQVYVYKWRDTNYVEVTTIVGYGAHRNDTFGKSLALSGDSNRLVVGALSIQGDIYVGTVCVYDWDEATTTYKVVTLLTTPSEWSTESFGASLALSGDGNMLIVGEQIVPKVRIYGWEAATSTYTEVASITDSSSRDCTQFGSSVVLSDNGNRLLVGAMFKGIKGRTPCGAGVVHIFDLLDTAE